MYEHKYCPMCKRGWETELSKAVIVYDMCMRERHDYGLRLTEDERRALPLSSGMTIEEADALRARMKDLYDIVRKGMERNRR